MDDGVKNGEAGQNCDHPTIQASAGSSRLGPTIEVARRLTSRVRPSAPVLTFLGGVPISPEDASSTAHGHLT